MKAATPEGEGKQWAQPTGRVAWSASSRWLPRRVAGLVGGLGLFGCLAAWGQAGPTGLPVVGTVRDAQTNRLLPGVAVRLPRSRQGTVTDGQGGFRILARPADTLVVQALGYKPCGLRVPGGTRASLVVQVRLQPDSIRLGEVRVTADHLDRSSVNRALRNLRRPVALLSPGPLRPARPRPLFPVDSTPPPPPPPGGTPLDWAYERLSRAGKERRKLQQVKAQETRRQAQQRLLRYNKAFKNNRGYE